LLVGATHVETDSPQDAHRRIGLRHALKTHNDASSQPWKELRMLVLSRQRDETIMIGDDIEITIVDIRGDKVRLGISAPNAVPVHRKEVYDAIKRENLASAGMDPGDFNRPANANNHRHSLKKNKEKDTR
jgi:carbon storage regulator